MNKSNSAYSFKSSPFHLDVLCFSLVYVLGLQVYLTQYGNKCQYEPANTYLE